MLLLVSRNKRPLQLPSQIYQSRNTSTPSILLLIFQWISKTLMPNFKLRKMWVLELLSNQQVPYPCKLKQKLIMRDKVMLMISKQTMLSNNSNLILLILILYFKRAKILAKLIIIKLNSNSMIKNYFFNSNNSNFFIVCLIHCVNILLLLKPQPRN